MAIPWMTILSLALRVLGWFFEKRAENVEAKKAFLDFVAVMESHQLASAKLNESDRAQVDDLIKQRERLQNGNA